MTDKSITNANQESNILISKDGATTVNISTDDKTVSDTTDILNENVDTDADADVSEPTSEEPPNQEPPSQESISEEDTARIIDFISKKDKNKKLKEEEAERVQVGLDALLENLSEFPHHLKVAILQNATIKVEWGQGICGAMKDDLLLKGLIKLPQLEVFCKSEKSRDFFQYIDDRWLLHSDDSVSDTVATCLTEHTTFNDSKVAGVTRLLKRLAPIKPERQPGLIAMLNGVVDTKTKQFHPHHKKFGIQGYIDVFYDPDATECPVFDNFINQLANGSEERKLILLTVIYYHIANRYDKKVFTEIVGNGDTGKSTFAKLICMFVGSETTAHLDLMAVEGKNKDAHALEGLDRCSMLVYSEIPSISSELKVTRKISGQDLVSINPKNKARYSAMIRATQLFVGNDALIIKDKTSAMHIRRITVLLNRVFEKEEQDSTILDRVKQEIPAIINKLLAFMTESKFDELLKLARTSSDKREVVISTDNIASWINDCIEVTNNPSDQVQTGSRIHYKTETPTGKLYRAKEKLFENYLSWFENANSEVGGNAKPIGLKSFIERLPTCLYDNFKLEKKFKFTDLRGNKRGLKGILLNKKAQHLKNSEEQIEQRKHNIPCHGIG